MKGRVLIIAGSDSGGGAGIQADIKAVTALGGYAATAVTAITVQNTLGVFGVHPIPLDIVRDQIRVVMDDIGADALKTGMLATVETVEAVVQAIDAYAQGVALVVDPVMIAKGGHPLLEPRAPETVRTLMLPRAALVTPNAPEAEALTGIVVADLDGQKRAAEKLLVLGAKAALVKGGHVDGPTLRDVLATPDGFTIFESHRIETRATHGTGCTLASAIAAKLAQGESLEEAVRAAREYLLEAIRRAPGFGAGHGPLDHGWPMRGWTTRERG
ncbi:MAG: bifunctional hydroxymethylpyrimidine kinase/phosphomethylpyrimidine kinase [Alphaproteobacteria bacterium]|nr:bifunctional hydroxymethylpyrimidine kinase/phosphomethylpyrimidine kinase [Alphaproteobacteria bacterium]